MIMKFLLLCIGRYIPEIESSFERMNIVIIYRENKFYTQSSWKLINYYKIRSTEKNDGMTWANFPHTISPYFLTLVYP